MPSLRPVLTFSAVLAVVFAVSVTVGYVYEHDPERDLVEVVIDRSALPVNEGEFSSGSILALDGNTAQITGPSGTLEVPLSSVLLEELRPLDDPSRLAPGTPLNLGGERAATEPVISGVVLFAPEATP